MTEEVVEELDSRYFNLRNDGDPQWRGAFSQARAGSAALAAQRGDLGRAAYEAKHAGVPEADLVAIAEQRL